MDQSLYDKIIIGIDPGTRVMGYGILGIKGKEPQLIAMGVLKLNLMDDHYMRLHHIYERVSGLVKQYLPDEMAIEAPFFGKNVQSMLKLGRAQGVAMAAALNQQIPITEYEPRKIKIAITGNGAASKEQVCAMLQRTLHIAQEDLPKFLDATDALAAALCHFYESQKPQFARGPKSWKSFIAQNPDRVSFGKKGEKK
ncbi:MAG: crossover junction endodeoxyribonuclease RuvC [bacterium]|nr:crossover junction endodeoxyribonuclease RuvC [Muribaculaceae bacterium]MDD5818705.1 crossover junction endodeoxyribonuclease RuvC [bacterium]MDD6832641.1 crossover junction endodeoxyribonuclease RuvC [bacterium]MDD6901685.1 crossover junction endodeoxyribonuclease RuvC [bacterium]MDY4185371.1 crossover junction endodeoxyribonuclease RuvC [Sodaliphilus sp.]